jgi:glycosyltransferase involved in cell wall biosynthesis
MRVLAIYPWESFWSMGERSGVASFFYAVHAYIDHGHTVDVVLPGRRVGLAEERYHDMTLTRVPFAADPMDVGWKGAVGLAMRWRRYASFRNRMVAAACHVSQRCRPDVVIGVGAYAAQAAHRVALSRGVNNVTRLFGQSLILHMDDEGRIRNPIRFYANFPEVLALRTPCAALIMHDDGSRGDLVAKRLGVPADRLHYWRDGVDIPAVDCRNAGREFKRQLGCAADAVVAMSVARMSPEKNLDLVVEAFARAAAHVTALHLVFVGDGPCRGEIEERVRRAGVTDRVHFAGHVTRDALGAAFAAADFVVSLSKRTNMTNSTIEAMAAGVPCVALDSGNTAAVVQDERTGLLVGRPSAHAIAESMCRLTKDETLRSTLGNNARAFAAAEFERVQERLAREVALVASLSSTRG